MDSMVHKEGIDPRYYLQVLLVQFQALTYRYSPSLLIHRVSSLSVPLVPRVYGKVWCDPPFPWGGQAEALSIRRGVLRRSRHRRCDRRGPSACGLFGDMWWGVRGKVLYACTA